MTILSVRWSEKSGPLADSIIEEKRLAQAIGRCRYHVLHECSLTKCRVVSTRVYDVVWPGEIRPWECEHPQLDYLQFNYEICVDASVDEIEDNLKKSPRVTIQRPGTFRVLGRRVVIMKRD